MTRALILLGITALACRDKEAPKAATPGSAAVATPGSAAPATPRSDKAPVLPAFGSAMGSGSVEDRFKAEDADPVWKQHTEADINALLAKHHATTECRASICRLSITGDEAEISAAIDDLQVFHDHAQSLVLSRPEPTKIVAYLTFERAD